MNKIYIRDKFISRAYYNGKRILWFPRKGNECEPTYLDLDWVSTNGNGFFETDYVSVITTSVECKFEIVNLYSPSWVFGGYVASSNIGIAFGTQASGREYMFSAFGKRTYGSDLGVTQTIGEHTVEISYASFTSNKLQIDETSKTYSGRNVGNTVPLMILGCKRLESDGSASKTPSEANERFYYLKVFEGSTLKHHYIPKFDVCKNTVVLYDIVDDVYVQPTIIGENPFNYQVHQDYTLYGYISNENGELNIELDSYMDKETVCQLHFVPLVTSGDEIIGSVGNSDSNYNFRVFEYSNARYIYFDGLGVRNSTSSSSYTTPLNQNGYYEFGYDVANSKKYMKKITENDIYQSDNIVGYGNGNTNFINANPSSSFTQSGNFTVMKTPNDITAVYRFRVFKFNADSNTYELKHDYRAMKDENDVVGIVDVISGTKFYDSNNNAIVGN